MLQNQAFSQEEVTTQKTTHSAYIGLTIGSSDSYVTNQGTNFISELSALNKRTLYGSAELGIMLSRHFGLSLGVGYIPFSTKLSLENYQGNYEDVDLDYETYERQVFGNAINELQKIGFLSIPVSLQLRLPVGNKLGIFVKPGVNVAFPIIKTYETNGTFSFKGYYPAYNVLFEDIPEYGFPSNASSYAKGNLDLKPYCLIGSVSAGVDFSLSEFAQIAVAVQYNRSLLNISNSTQTENYILSTKVNEIKSFMGNSSNVTAGFIGIDMSIRFLLK